MFVFLAVLAGILPVSAQQSFEPYSERAYRLVNSVAFSPDGQTLYFALLHREVLAHRGTPDPEAPEVAMYSARRMPGGGWSEPELVEFSGIYKDYEPTITPDGSLMVFNSQRPWPDGRITTANDLWMVEFDGDAWGEPRRIEALSSFEQEESYSSITADRRLVYVRRVSLPDGRTDHDLYESRMVDGEFSEPIRVSVSSERWGESDPWIAPDGSYLIFTRWDDSVGWAETVDMYISFDRDGEWSEPVAMVDHNTEGADFSPAVSPDGEWFYYRAAGRFVRVPMRPVLDRYGEALR